MKLTLAILLGILMCLAAVIEAGRIDMHRHNIQDRGGLGHQPNKSPKRGHDQFIGGHHGSNRLGYLGGGNRGREANDPRRNGIPRNSWPQQGGGVSSVATANAQSSGNGVASASATANAVAGGGRWHK